MLVLVRLYLQQRLMLLETSLSLKTSKSEDTLLSQEELKSAQALTQPLELSDGTVQTLKDTEELTGQLLEMTQEKKIHYSKVNGVIQAVHYPEPYLVVNLSLLKTTSTYSVVVQEQVQPVMISTVLLYLILQIGVTQVDLSQLMYVHLTSLSSTTLSTYSAAVLEPVPQIPSIPLPYLIL